MAIRRPHKAATVGTDVFTVDDLPINTVVSTGFDVDLAIAMSRDGSTPYLGSRLQGNNKFLSTRDQNKESNYSGWEFDHSDSFNQNQIGSNPISWLFSRSPGFMDVVAYTGTGSNQTVSHNLGAIPELIILKKRSNNNYWHVFADSVISPNSDWYQNFGTLNTDSHFASFTAAFTGAPTSTTLPLTGGSNVGASNDTYLAYALRQPTWRK